MIADSVTVTNATDCIMDGTTTNIIIGDSLRNLWLHDGRVNPGAGVTTPTSTEDTITVNGVDLKINWKHYIIRRRFWYKSRLHSNTKQLHVDGSCGL